jgi:hypothetical protein
MRTLPAESDFWLFHYGAVCYAGSLNGQKIGVAHGVFTS